LPQQTAGLALSTLAKLEPVTDFTLTKTSPLGPIIRRITAVGSDIQVTVDRPYSDAYVQVAYAYPTFVYVRPSGYALHRPFDGGVEMSTGAGNSFAQIIRQTRKYFRYQSGKGIQTSFAINFKPSIDIESMERLSPTTIECKTRRTHNLVSGLTIRVAEAQDYSRTSKQYLQWRFRCSRKPRSGRWTNNLYNYFSWDCSNWC